MNGLGRKKEENKENKSLIFTKETLGVVLILFATLALVCLITRETVFSSLGQAVNAFLFGVFGFFAYAVILFAIIMGVLLVSDKKTGVSKRMKTLITCSFSLVALIAHIATISAQGTSYGEYISASYLMGQGGISTTSAGGVMTALVAYLFSNLLTDVGSFVVLGIALTVFVYAMITTYLKTPFIPAKKEGKFRSSFVEESLEDGLDIAGTKEYPVENVDFATVSGKQKLFVNNPEEFALKNKRELMKEQTNPQANGVKITFASSGLGVVETGARPKQVNADDDFRKKIDYVKTPAEINVENITSGNYSAENRTVVSGYVNSQRFERKEEIPFINHEQEKAEIIEPEVNDTAQSRAERFENLYAQVDEQSGDANVNVVEASEIFRAIEKDECVNQKNNSEEKITEQDQSFDIPFIDESGEDFVVKPKDEEIGQDVAEEEQAFNEAQQYFDQLDKQEQELEKEKEAELPPTSLGRSGRLREIFMDENQTKPEEEKPVFTSRVEADNNLGSRRGLFETKKEEIVQEQKEEKPKPPINREYFRPPFDLLENYVQPINAVQDNHEERKQIIQRTLEEFHINAVPQGHIQGPSITRYEIMMPAGISVRKVLAYDDDLKMRLAAKDGVRIEAPIPGKNLVGIEVANSVKVTVGLREVMEGLAGKNSKPTALMFAVGKDIVGNSISYDLAKGPHYLIAGATGSGKSVALHVMIVSLLMRYSPEELKLVLIDPKSVEFRKYEHIPHLLVDEIITEPKRALALLQWAYDETNRRNEMFTECGGMISNIDDYNTQIANDKIAKLPRIVFVIDELADLMEAAKKDLEEKIRRIAAKSRSAGIHLVLATQRPSVDVITGTIKANLPSRIALKVMNFADSQTILGGAGAEKLLGNGDMLFKDSTMGDYERYQGAYISGREVANVVSYIKEHNTAYFDDDVQSFLDKETRPKQEEVGADVGGEDGGEMNDLLLKALWLAVNTQTVSISSLQRRFQIGYARAGGLVDKMEQMGFVSGNEGSKARRVLLTKEEFINRFGPYDEADG